MGEYNANFQLDEARSIMPPANGESWLRWDESTYQGCSLLALKLLLQRFNYSVVWCNKVNCLAVRDSELGCSLRLPLEAGWTSTAVTTRNGLWPSLTMMEGGEASRMEERAALI